MSNGEVVITHAELEREAELEIERRFGALGVDKPVRPARLGAGLEGRARMSAREWESECLGIPWKRKGR